MNFRAAGGADCALALNASKSKTLRRSIFNSLAFAFEFTAQGILMPHADFGALWRIRADLDTHCLGRGLALGVGRDASVGCVGWWEGLQRRIVGEELG